MSNELHDAKTGQFAPAGSDPATTVKVEENRLSPWRKEAERLLDAIELGASENDPGYVDVVTVALVVHIQTLKRA